jgi:hypothetical protein
MRTLAKVWVLVLTTAVTASVLAGPALAEDPSGSAKPSGGTTGKAPGVAPASLPVGIDIGHPIIGPLTGIVIGQDLSCAVNHRDDGLVGEFYGDRACGTFLALNGVLYGPPNIPAGGAATPLTPWMDGRPICRAAASVRRASKVVTRSKQTGRSLAPARRIGPDLRGC